MYKPLLSYFSIFSAVTFRTRNTRPYSKSCLLGITFKAKTCWFKTVSKPEDSCKKVGEKNCSLPPLPTTVVGFKTESREKRKSVRPSVTHYIPVPPSVCISIEKYLKYTPNSIITLPKHFKQPQYSLNVQVHPTFCLIRSVRFTKTLFLKQRQANEEVCKIEGRDYKINS